MASAKAKEEFKVFLKKAHDLGYKAEIISEEGLVGRLTKDDKRRYVIGALLPLNTSVSARLSKDKYITKKILSDIGISVPNGILATNWEEVEKALSDHKITFPLVVKPNSAALGTLVSVNLTKKDELKKSLANVFEKYTEAIVEEFLPWNDHRLFVVDGKMEAAARRIQPYVMGDGISNVQDLVNALNAKKGEKKVQIDDEAKRYLKNQDLDLDSILESGRKIQIRGNANIQTGGFIEDVTDIIDKKFVSIAETSARELGMRLSGVDMLCEDIKNSKSPYVITEVNGLPSYPYIHDHPDIGKPRDPVVEVLKAIFK